MRSGPPGRGERDPDQAEPVRREDCGSDHWRIPGDRSASPFSSNFSTFLGKPGIYLEDLYVQPGMRGLRSARPCCPTWPTLQLERDCGRLGGRSRVESARPEVLRFDWGGADERMDRAEDHGRLVDQPGKGGIAFRRGRRRADRGTRGALEKTRGFSCRIAGLRAWIAAGGVTGVNGPTV